MLHGPSSTRLVRCFGNCRETRTLQGTEVQEHYQEQLTQTLLVCLLKTHLFLLNQILGWTRSPLNNPPDIHITKKRRKNGHLPSKTILWASHLTIRPRLSQIHVTEFPYGLQVCKLPLLVMSVGLFYPCCCGTLYAPD